MIRNLSSKSFAAPALGLALGIAVLAGGTIAWAGRPLSGKFDLSAPMTLSGVVTSVDWRNPQVHVFMNVVTGKQTANWAVELDSQSELEMDGFSRETLRPGDIIVVKGIKARDGSRQVFGQDVRYKSNGLEVFPAKLAASRTPLTARPTPKWPDGHPALGALPGMVEGYWTDPSKTVLVEDGVDVKMNADGLLANMADLSKVAPMQPWALGLYRYRQERGLRDDPLFINCKPPGGVRQLQSRLGIEFVEDRARNRIFVLVGSGNHNYHIIYMDGRKQVGQAGGDDDNPLYYGRSVGKWEGNTLVVDTKGFNEDFWFTQGGLPHTSDLHLIEKFTRTDNETLQYQVEIDDPGAYTRKWSASWTLKWNGGATLPSFFCQNNRP